ncbi:MAG: GNAT family N-acetyltransferase [Polaromonas sp.]|uniref:GNAT family N-acetyltransferase n=1 Tax=Polaromonas sp. TaxID=1869339 RepID=UPI002488746D|nr:GNAT family N-acetyltransferase [Polaromonas sp.]MDI1268976.1 GNAT family N-acetyltransferase [Polaromonas sp.]
MANTDAAVVVETLGPLTPAVQAGLDALVLQSGWNQTPQDWAIFSREGSVCVVRDAQSRIIASGAVLPHGPQVAWISMILVAPDLRGRGLGRAVFLHCLALVKAGGRTACLDATPDGQRIYSQFGFAPVYGLTRWQRAARPQAVPAARSQQLPDAQALAALDAQALGAPRHALLADFLARPDAACVRSSEGFAIVRRGRIAHQIGPLLALNEAGAAELMKRAVQDLAGPVFIDVPDERALLARQLHDAGFTPQRSFMRMVLGDQPLQGQTHFIHAIAGPEFG